MRRSLSSLALALFAGINLLGATGLSQAEPMGHTKIEHIGERATLKELIARIPDVRNQAIGMHNGRGSLPSRLVDAVRLSDIDDTIVTAVPDLDYGTDDLVKLIVYVSKKLEAELPEHCAPLTVMRLSKRGGGEITGPFKTGSHQNGLNADFGFFNAECGQDSASHVVGWQVEPSFDVDANWKFFTALVSESRKLRSDGRIAMLDMYVDKAIKWQLCQRYQYDFDPLTQDTLHLLRPRWMGRSGWIWHRFHKNHIHITLRCPQGDHLCENTSGPRTYRCPDGTKACAPEVRVKENGCKEVLHEKTMRSPTRF